MPPLIIGAIVIALLALGARQMLRDHAQRACTPLQEELERYKTANKNIRESAQKRDAGRISHIKRIAGKLGTACGGRNGRKCQGKAYCWNDACPFYRNTACADFHRHKAIGRRLR